MTVTATDIITLALKDAGVTGVGQSPTAEDISDGMRRLNFMLSQWSSKRWLIYHLVATSLTSTGAQSYTVGTGGNFNISRPDRLEDAYMRLLNPGGQNQVDYPLQIIEAREDYDRIALKSLVSWPSYCFYDSNYPLGSVYFWPIPTAALYSLFIVTKAVLQQFTTPGTVFIIPDEYQAALLYNLGVRMRPAYQLPPDPTLTSLAVDSLNVIRKSNAQVPRLRMPANLRRTGLYDIYSDRVY